MACGYQPLGTPLDSSKPPKPITVHFRAYLHGQLACWYINERWLLLEFPMGGVVT